MKKKKAASVKVRKPKKFRWLYLATWLGETYEPCKIADIGGGKGMLSYILSQKYGWDCTVIEPEKQDLLEKYTDLEKQKIEIEKDEKIKYVAKPFSKEMAENYDLLIGLHAHGVNMHMIEACKEYGKDFFLVPCCVIDEPIVKEFGVNWRESLVDYATGLGFDVKKVQLNFKGKNIGIYSDRGLKKRENGDKELIKKILIDPRRSVLGNV